MNFIKDIWVKYRYLVLLWLITYVVLVFPRIYAILQGEPSHTLLNLKYISVNLLYLVGISTIFLSFGKFGLRVWTLFICGTFFIRMVNMVILSSLGIKYSAPVIAHLDMATVKAGFIDFWWIVYPGFAALGALFYFLFFRLPAPKFTLPYKIVNCLGGMVFMLVSFRTSHKPYQDFDSYLLLTQVQNYFFRPVKWDEIKVSDNEKAFLDQRGINFSLPKISEGNISQKKNLLVVYLESFRLDWTGIGGNERKEMTPNIDEFAKSADYFPHHYSSVRPTVSALITSQCGFLAEYTNYDIADIIGMGVGVVCLPDILNHFGYQQELLVAVPKNFSGTDEFANYHNFDYLAGFGEITTEHPKYLRTKAWGLYDLDLFEYALERITKLSKGKKPYHLSFFTMGTHGPSYVTPDECPKIDGTELEVSIHCADFAFGKFMGDLKKLGIYDDLNIIVIGDHMPHARPLYGKVFLAIKKSGQKEGRVLDWVSHTPDIAPTALKLSGFDVENLYAGQDIYTGRKNFTHLLAPKFDVVSNQINYHAEGCTAAEAIKVQLPIEMRPLSACELRRVFLFQEKWLAGLKVKENPVGFKK